MDTLLLIDYGHSYPSMLQLGPNAFIRIAPFRQTGEPVFYVIIGSAERKEGKYKRSPINGIDNSSGLGEGYAILVQRPKEGINDEMTTP